MLARDEEIINTYLDGASIKEMSSYFSCSEEEVLAKVVQYRVLRVLRLTPDFGDSDNELTIIGQFVGEGIDKINRRLEPGVRRRIRSIIKLIEDGLTMAGVAKVFQISRERVRQILKKYSPELLIANESRKFNECEVCGESKKGVRPRSKYRAICEKCYKKIVKSKAKKWSREFDKCIDCGTTEVPHHIKGRCRRCHAVFSYHFDLERNKSIKKSSKKWRIRNQEKIRENNRNVAMRLRQRALGGNRELAIKRDEYKCRKCGMTTEQSLSRYKRGLYVSHVNKDTKDNSLNNLISMCVACHNNVHSRSKKSHKGLVEGLNQ